MVERANRPKASAAVADQFLKWPARGGFLAGAVLGVGIADEDGAIAAQQREGLVGQRIDGAIDGFEIALSHADKGDAEERSVRSVDAPRQDDGRLAGDAVAEGQRYAQPIVVIGGKFFEVFSVGDIDVGRRPGRGGHDELSANVGHDDLEGLGQIRQLLHQRAAEAADVERAYRVGRGLDLQFDNPTLQPAQDDVSCLNRTGDLSAERRGNVVRVPDTVMDGV